MIDDFIVSRQLFFFFFSFLFFLYVIDCLYSRRKVGFISIVEENIFLHSQPFTIFFPIQKRQVQQFQLRIEVCIAIVHQRPSFRCLTFFSSNEKHSAHNFFRAQPFTIALQKARAVRRNAFTYIRPGAKVRRIIRCSYVVRTIF